MSREYYKNTLFKAITDPYKREYIESLNDSMLKLMVSPNLRNEEWEELETQPQAYNIRTIYIRRAIDEGSGEARILASIREKFTSQPNYLPKNILLSNLQALRKADRKILSQHPHYLSSLSSEYGVEVLGGIPEQDKVRLLIAHDQLVHTADVQFPTPLRSSIYSIPQLLKPAELFVNGTRPTHEMMGQSGDSPITVGMIGNLMHSAGNDVYFTMESLEYGRQIWDVVFE